MLIGKVIYEKRKFSVLFDQKEEKVYEILSPIEQILKNHEEIDLNPTGIEIEKVKIDIPITPTKIVCVGRNYSEHAKELDNEVPEEPIIFLKPPSSLIPHKGRIIYPSLSSHVDFEGELALVIRRKIKGEKAENIAQWPEEYYAWTGFLDITARDLQKKDRLWTRAKGFDTFGPLGPWINLTTQVKNLNIQTFVNGELKQNSNTKKMIFPPERIIEYVSEVMSLEPGDIIATGTPEGVGKIKVGDTVLLKIGGLPELEVSVRK